MLSPASSNGNLFKHHIAPNGAAYAVGALLLVLLFAGAYVSDRFATLPNLLNVHQQATGLAMVALGQTVAILTGGIDLSVGSVANFATIFVTWLQTAHHFNPLVAVLVALLVSFVVGGVNGLLVVKFGVSSFIATLGMATVIGAFQTIECEIRRRIGVPEYSHDHNDKHCDDQRPRDAAFCRC